MSEPDFTILRSGREPDGSLAAEDVQRIAGMLSGGGFVLLPSDTAYSVAAIPRSEQTRHHINVMLRRRDMPVSLAFPGAEAARRWISADPVTERLLDRFCPGPITVVCRVFPGALPVEMLSRTVAGGNRTIGIRVPDSVLERTVAGATWYPVTTVAVRVAETDETVTDFETALEIVRAGTAEIGDPRWCAVEGETFYDQHSTVVEVTGDGTRLRLIREGQIPFSVIRDSIRDLPNASSRSTEIS